MITIISRSLANEPDHEFVVSCTWQNFPHGKYQFPCHLNTNNPPLQQLITPVLFVTAKPAQNTLHIHHENVRLGSIQLLLQRSSKNRLLTSEFATPERGHQMFYIQSTPTKRISFLFSTSSESFIHTFEEIYHIDQISICVYFDRCLFRNHGTSKLQSQKRQENTNDH